MNTRGKLFRLFFRFRTSLYPLFLGWGSWFDLPAPPTWHLNAPLISLLGKMLCFYRPSAFEENSSANFKHPLLHERLKEVIGDKLHKKKNILAAEIFRAFLVKENDRNIKDSIN